MTHDFKESESVTAMSPSPIGERDTLRGGYKRRSDRKGKKSGKTRRSTKSKTRGGKKKGRGRKSRR